MYHKLDPGKTIETIEVLSNRIKERFPGSGLHQVCEELIGIAKKSKERADWFAKPNLWVRMIVGIVILGSLVMLIYSFNYIKITAEVFTWGEFIQIMEAGINCLILTGAALLFLFTFELRLKRKRAMAALYELRAVAHVIDMHQLTKDPSKVLIQEIATPSSPISSFTAFELTRYLDYSSELLSLVGKIAAIYGENLKDQMIISAANEIEDLTTGLSRKIWQKIMILNINAGDN